MFLPRAADAATSRAAAAGLSTILRDTLELKLDFAPGTRFAYSNIGYQARRRGAIERTTGVRRGAGPTLQERVLARAGGTAMQIGRTLAVADGEVTWSRPGCRRSR